MDKSPCLSCAGSSIKMGAGKAIDDCVTADDIMLMAGAGNFAVNIIWDAIDFDDTAIVMDSVWDQYIKLSEEFDKLEEFLKAYKQQNRDFCAEFLHRQRQQSLVYSRPMSLNYRCCRYYLRSGFSKSGWLGKVAKRRKGKCGNSK